MTSVPEFKICGMRTLEHALAAADAGASLLGFVFVPGVRRQVSLEHAQVVIRRVRERRGAACPSIVGLFANQPLDEVNRTVSECDLDFVQLCGDEPADYWDNVDAWVMRQVKVDDSLGHDAAVSDALREVEEVAKRLHITLLDKRVSGALGGTGHTFDWQIACEIAKRHPVFLAGGLAPDNVRQAIDTVQPWGVDVSSGVETNGVKDIAKIAAFADMVKQAAHAHNDGGGAQS
ncbi:MAG: phosphoribosylanthranilate isomerase [Chloroflexi bacterium]|nr:phosphoribosylanthranilate isomerase [Chloroflexota bacterium]